jgi:ubiquinone/menaquinone biosynthesis C-methylase UbiE
MERIIEPELMEDEAQAKAYSEANFDVEHSTIVGLIDDLFGAIEIAGEILDIGCGAGDVTYRIAKRFPKASITAIDGSVAMLKLAEERKLSELHNSEQVHFVKALVPSNDIPEKAYDLIVSTSFLHHLHDPSVLWETIKKYSKSETAVFVADLTRPKDESVARWIVNEFSKNEPGVLKEDFYNSLLASFTPNEIEEQLYKSGLTQLSVHVDRYVVVHGKVGDA